MTAWAGAPGNGPYPLPDLLHGARAIVDDAMALARGIRPDLTIEVHTVDR